jgi:hypothetical protein
LEELVRKHALPVALQPELIRKTGAVFEDGVPDVLLIGGK